MGLRSRQRRMQGVSHEDSFDVETSKHRTQSLEDHLQASRHDVDERNKAWRQSVGTSGFVMCMYEAGLYGQTLMIEQFFPENPQLCLVFKVLAIASMALARQYVTVGSSAAFSGATVLIAAYVVMWLAAKFVFELQLTVLQASPIPVVYYIACLLVSHFVGTNTKAEVARAEQLQKLEQVYNKDHRK